MPEPIVAPTPGETVAPAVTTDPVVQEVTSDAPPQAGTDASPDSEALRLKKSQETRERIEELNAQKRAALEYGEFWRKQFEDSQKAQPAAVAPSVVAPAVDPEPQLDDFEDSATYAKAYGTWARKEAVREAKQVAEHAVKESQSAAEKAVSKAREEERLRTLDGGFAKRAQEYAEKFPDFYTAISNPALTFFNGDFLDALKGNEKGPEIAHHISQSPKLVAQLASQSVPQRLATLGRLEAELSRPAPPPKVTTAPTPPSPVGGGSGGEPDPSKMSTTDWMSWRTKDIQAKRLQR